ncbi:DUF1649-domain-containing protein [Hymenopellis radicata]|nr:DUF1649-domain-containing protein [Hymenopellis radicata]
MNNYPTITIDLIVDRSTCRDVLRGTIHAILFHRSFGTVKPRTFEVLDVTMPGISDVQTEQLVNDKVDMFWKGIDIGASKRGQIVVTFSEKRPKKSWFQVYMGEEDVPWEQWIINAEVRQPPDRERTSFESTLAATLTKSIFTMITYTTSEKGRAAVPLITDATGISPFPIRITVKIGGVEVGL